MKHNHECRWKTLNNIKDNQIEQFIKKLKYHNQVETYFKNTESHLMLNIFRGNWLHKYNKCENSNNHLDMYF